MSVVRRLTRIPATAAAAESKLGDQNDADYDVDSPDLLQGQHRKTSAILRETSGFMTAAHRYSRLWRGVWAVLLIGLGRFGAACGQSVSTADASASAASGLPRPSAMSVGDYERQLFEFLNERQYQRRGWRVDKGVRDTGPYVDGKYYGTHPAVRVYYSPEIIEWLRGGRRDVIPDGAMIIKEQFEPPAARYADLNDEQLFKALSSWTVMVKDSAGSHDGWFWSNPAKGQSAVDGTRYPFDNPVSGFGIYCVRCHASTKSTGATNEYTFASLRNIKGFPGKPLVFRVDESWRAKAEREEPTETKPLEDTTNEALLAQVRAQRADPAHPRCTGVVHPEQCPPVLSDRFLATFASIAPHDRSEIEHFPPVTHDWVVRRAGAAQLSQPFVTSNQCMSCHAGLLGAFGPSMFLPTGDSAEYADPGVHLSPYGEWRWTPMGLAGRDPVFYAQLESEIELLRREHRDDQAQGKHLADELQKTCLSCHGVMGKRQFDLDQGAGGEEFTVAQVMNGLDESTAGGPHDWRYGALARDGVSCTVCHHMQPREQPPDDHRPYLEFYLENSITGNLHLGAANELAGPFEDKDVSPYAMEHALGFKPKHNPYIKSSQLCGTCHVVNLPIVDRAASAEEAGGQLVAAEQNAKFKAFHHHVEQSTYLEWLNSEFENEINPANPNAKTCQDCHMARGYHDDERGLHIDPIVTRMAAIQDNTYPAAENLAEREALEVRVRSTGYARHNFRGLNVFLLEMFNQFDDVLGVRKFDFMTGSTEDIPLAVADFGRQARTGVATVAVEARVSGDELVAKVDVHNQTGHRFPSGVGFRRAFLEFVVTEKPAAEGGEGRVIWSSGRTNELGMIVDENGEPLPSEFFGDNDSSHPQAFQPHHDVITSPRQVQIYETLLRNAGGRLTTSFVHGSDVAKDNRLLPRGWKKDGPGPALHGEFLRATYPDAATQEDPRYADGSGSDEVTYRVKLPRGVDPERVSVAATLYYQAIPPYFLRQLFETAPSGPATVRLHYLCSNIDLRGTPIENWKLKVATATAAVAP